MHDLLYENQQDLDEKNLRHYAAELGLDLSRFDSDLAEHRYAPRVEDDCLGGERSGVEGTPAFFVNGVRYAGPIDLEALLGAIEEAAGGPSDARADPLEQICSERRGVNTGTLKKVVELAVEIAREGREGRKIGTLFVVGDSDEVLENLQTHDP